MHTMENNSQLEIYAPSGIHNFLGYRTFTRESVALHQIARECRGLPDFANGKKFFLDPQKSCVLVDDADMRVTCCQIVHSVFCLGYVIEEKRRPSINVKLLTEKYGLEPCKQYRDFLEGRDVLHKGVLIPRGEALIPHRGRKVGKAPL